MQDLKIYAIDDVWVELGENAGDVVDQRPPLFRIREALVKTSPA